MTFLFGALVILIGASIATYVYQVSSQRLTQASGQKLTMIAESVANMLSTTLREREREIILLSEHPIFQNQANTAAIQSTLNKIKHSYEHYAWIGYASVKGRVISAGDGLLEGADVSQRPWFIEGAKGPFVGDVHKALLLASLIEPMEDGSLPRFVDFAAPVHNAEGQLLGVVATHSNWMWVGGVLAAALPDSTDQDDIQIFIVDKDYEILYPDSLVGQTIPTQQLPNSGSYQYSKWQDQQNYLTARTSVISPNATELGWQIIVRQPEKTALSAVREMLLGLWIIGAFASLIAMIIVYQLAGTLSRPIERLVAVAHSIQNGNRNASFKDENSKLNEVSSLSYSLQSMMSSLIEREQSLVQINATLESKVQERTTALKLANSELAHLAMHDPLTQCFNRLALDQAINQHFQNAQAQQYPLAVIMIDADHFKNVNDTYGHKAGDYVLKQLVSFISENARENDLVARFGGEEFTLLLPDTDANEAFEIAERIRRLVESHIFLGIGQVTISLGVACYQDSDSSPDMLLNRADHALYYAKAHGRNQTSLKS